MNAGQAVLGSDVPNPYCSAAARDHSNYTAFVQGELVRLLDGKAPTPQARMLHEAMQSLLSNDRYPCVGARAALNGRHYRFGSYGRLGSKAVTRGLARDLCAFVAERPSMHAEYATYFAFFEDRRLNDERAFESRLWKQLQALHELDVLHFAYDPDVDADPGSARFAFSFAGSAFFVVGMHPGSARLARRFAYPALIFNAHAQFTSLRAKGLYERFAAVVRQRELSLQGSLNPNLSEFGTHSEARQYAGRSVEDDWECPYRP
ncbi:MAG: guanitoxin biosynthesis heme-dependent pre-guanitoxin N-hydroxylase GntA [Vulcanimicrobiaceae bacterium]